MSSDIPAPLLTQALGAASPGSLRKERGAIAAQACDTCRSRKQKCDEQRPRCATCQKFKLECNYREPQPTKKDKTLSEILDRVKSLEGKVDTLSLRSSSVSTLYPPDTPTQASSLALGQPSTLDTSIFSMSDASAKNDGYYTYVSSVFQMLGWPMLQQALDSTDHVSGLATIERDGPSIALGQRRGQPQPLVPTSAAPNQGSSLAMSMQTNRSVQLAVPGLTWEAMQRLAKTYFDSFNLMYPVLDRQSFFQGAIVSAYNGGFDDGMDSTLALLVLALGEVALVASQGIPVHVSQDGRPSGVKGGTALEPPGLALFNQARSRMGFNIAECRVENVQVYILAALYYETCSHHMEFWRMTTSASLACQALITSNLAELSSERGDLIRRMFWHCCIMETSLHLELGLPLTGLEKLEHVVGLPDFSGPFTEDEYLGNQSSHFQEHFASQIVLRRLLVDFHGALHPAPSPGTPPSLPTIKQLAHQLDQWHGMLPEALKWQEDTPAAFPSRVQDEYKRGAPLSTTAPTALMFTSDLGAPPVPYPYALDVQVALLRTRYYHAKFLLHRPFLYKAVHQPDAVTSDDAAGAATCLRACLRWPVTMSPTSTRKRLVPCLFFWTQNVLAVLLALHLSQISPVLARIRASLCGERFELEAGETVGLCVDWVRDLSAVDGAAAWAWDVVKGLYRLE